MLTREVGDPTLDAWVVEKTKGVGVVGVLVCVGWASARLLFDLVVFVKTRTVPPPSPLLSLLN